MWGKGYEEKCGGKIGREMWKESRENVEGVELEEKKLGSRENVVKKCVLASKKHVGVNRAKNWVVNRIKMCVVSRLCGGGKLSENVRGSQKSLIFEWGHKNNIVVGVSKNPI